MFEVSKGLVSLQIGRKYIQQFNVMINNGNNLYHHRKMFSSILIRIKENFFGQCAAAATWMAQAANFKTTNAIRPEPYIASGTKPDFIK